MDGFAEELSRDMENLAILRRFLAVTSDPESREILERVIRGLARERLERI